MLSPEAIQKKEFEQSVLGGYRRDEVDDFLDELEADYTKLYTENIELVEKIKVCLAKIEDYKKDEEFLKTAIINAQRLNETTLREIELKEKEVEIASKEKAAAIVAEAQEQADALLKKAEEESADAVRVAQEKCKAEIEAEQKKADLEIRRIRKETETEQAKLDYIRGQVAEFKNTIIDLYKAHLTSITKLPEFKTEEKEDGAAPVVEEKKAEPVEQMTLTESLPEEAEQPQEKGENSNTVEFKLADKKPEAPKTEERKSKYENLKFGVDYNVNEDE